MEANRHTTTWIKYIKQVLEVLSKHCCQVIATNIKKIVLKKPKLQAKHLIFTNEVQTIRYSRALFICLSFYDYVDKVS